MLIQRFGDGALEQAFIVTERSSRAPAMKALILVSMVLVASYLAVTLVFIGPEGLRIYGPIAATALIFLAGLLALVRSDRYVRNAWLDPPVATVLALLVGAIIWAKSRHPGLTHFPDYAFTLLNASVLAVFASVSFPGAARGFHLWLAALLAATLAFIATLDAEPVIKAISTAYVCAFFSFSAYVSWELERRARTIFVTHEELVAERRKSESLLYNLLPPSVAARLKAGEAVADAFNDVTVVFVDLVGFTKLAKRVPVADLVATLNAFFLMADRCADQAGMEKVKTIGDAYLAVAGGVASPDAGATAALGFARALVAGLAEVGVTTGIGLAVRIGIHSGPAIGGVVGKSRMSYDYWGDTVNVASRLEAVAPVNGIAVSGPTHDRLAGLVAFAPAQVMLLKGIGETEVHVATLWE